ncbi:MAG: carboxypeptidase regulatory-like domain-containing protein [Candidatus Cloacimonadota bacterium]|nr:carboxypeptidase regulatory-like domain-containing protein [Candidatus Cloacimonadota bacterium]
MKKILTVILIIMLLTCSLLLGQTKVKQAEKVTDDKGKLAGSVTDVKGKPISKANIIIEGTEFQTRSKKSGSYSITNIPTGKYNVICEGSGFITDRVNDVMIRHNQTTNLNFVLTRHVVKDEEEDKGEVTKRIKASSGKTKAAKEAKDDSDKEGEETRGGEIEGIETIKDKSVSKFVIIEEDIEIVDDSEIEIIETIGKTTSDPVDEKPVPKTKEVKKARPSHSGVTASSYSGLKAGFVDDNKQFNYFLNFLEKYERRVKSLPIEITERIILNIKDGQGKSLPDAKIKVFAGKTELESGLSYSDGRYLFFPSEYKKRYYEYRLEVEYSGIIKKMMIYRQGKREIDISMANIQKASSENIPLDILFILDTTGSMGEEIKRLRNSIEIINLNISEISPTPDIRYGMVLYRDIEDVYNTKIIPFNDSLPEFQNQLSLVRADGGGDRPENLQSALKDALTKIRWRKNGVRLAFIITDAPPHLNYNQKYTYVSAVHDAKKKGIKLFSIGTGGLPLGGEYVLRQISQYTFANYVFLTYGEKGESEGGVPGSVSHHTGENFQTDKLEAIIIRKVKEELHNYFGKPLSGGDEYLQATKIETEENKVTLEKLFTRAITQLQDYSSIKIPDRTPAAVLPIMCSKEELKVNAEYFTANLLFAFSVNKTFKAIERNDLQKIIEEQKLQLTGFTDLNKAVEVGKIMGADMLIAGELYEKNDCFEIYMKLLNVETAEVLSVTKTRIDKSLGL